MGEYLFIVLLLLPIVAPRPTYVPDEYIVQLRPDLSAQDVMERIPGAHVTRVFNIGSLTFASVTVDKKHHDAVFKESNQDIDLIPNVVVQGFEDDAADGSSPPPPQPPQPLCYEQKTGETYWGLTRISQEDPPDFSPDDAYLFNDTGQCVDIYVMDTGVNVNHETFEGRAQAGYTAEELMDVEGAEDMSGHGTHVAGLAAGRIHGVAKHANIISVKVFNKTQSGSLSGILAGFDWIFNQTAKKAAAGRKVRSVINMSWGFHDPVWRYELLWDIIRALPSVAVAAAGNNGIDACQFAPARFDIVLTVSATNKSDHMLYDFGHCVDVLAPGVDMHSASNVDNTADSCKSGTSMAAGLVSGVIARHLEHFPTQPTTGDMRKRLQDTGLKGKTDAAKFNTPDLLAHISCNSDKEPVTDVPDWDEEYCMRQQYNGQAVGPQAAGRKPGSHPIVGLFSGTANVLAPNPSALKQQIIPHVPLMLPRVSTGIIASIAMSVIAAVTAVVVVTVMCRCRERVQPCEDNQEGTTGLGQETPNPSVLPTPVVDSNPAVPAKHPVVQDNHSGLTTPVVESNSPVPANHHVLPCNHSGLTTPVVESNSPVPANHHEIQCNHSGLTTPIVESNSPAPANHPVVQSNLPVPGTPVI